MTTLNQSHPPILFWELYEYDGIIRGQTCPHVPFWKARSQFEVVYEFKGKTAVYIIGTQDASITRADALEWCANHHAGVMVRTTVDLSPCSQPTKK